MNGGLKLDDAVVLRRLRMRMEVGLLSAMVYEGVGTE